MYIVPNAVWTDERIELLLGENRGVEAVVVRADALAEDLGEDHERTLLARLVVVKRLLAERRYDDAAVLAERLLPRVVAAYGEEHPRTARARLRLALALAGRRDLHRATAHAREALQGFEALGSAHPQTQQALRLVEALRAAPFVSG